MSKIGTGSVLVVSSTHRQKSLKPLHKQAEYKFLTALNKAEQIQQ